MGVSEIPVPAISWPTPPPPPPPLKLNPLKSNEPLLTVMGYIKLLHPSTKLIEDVYIIPVLNEFCFVELKYPIVPNPVTVETRLADVTVPVFVAVI